MNADFTPPPAPQVNRPGIIPPSGPALGGQESDPQDFAEREEQRIAPGKHKGSRKGK